MQDWVFRLDLTPILMLLVGLALTQGGQDML